MVKFKILTKLIASFVSKIKLELMANAKTVQVVKFQALMVSHIQNAVLTKFQIVMILLVRSVLLGNLQMALPAKNVHQIILKLQINVLNVVPLLEISIYGCRIWPLAGKIGQKSCVKVKDFT